MTLELPPLRDRLIRWANQNSGSDHLAGLAAMLALLEADFSALPGVKTERVPCANTSAQALRVRYRPEAPQQVLLSGHYDTVYGADNPFQRCELVDEVPASDTDYVATNAVDQLDTYTHTALAGAAHVLCVQVQARAVQEGAPTPLNLKAALRSVGVDYLGTNSLVPTTNYKALSYVWQTNPLDGSPWTPAIVNATEIGMKSAT